VSAPKIFKIEQPMTNAERYEKNQRTLGQSKDFGNANSTDNLHNDGEELSNDQIKAILDGRVAQRSNKEYAPTKIKNCLNMDSYYVHYSHPINVMLRDYNDFTKIVFKILNKKDIGVSKEQAYALKLARRLGLNLNKNHLSISFLKVREQSNAIKEKLL